MKKAEKIQRALDRLEKFRRWFRQIPEEQIRLDDFLLIPNVKVSASFYYKTLTRRSDLTACGTVGCVAGWCSAWLRIQGDARTSPDSASPDSALGVDLLTGRRKGQLEGVFGPRQQPHQAERVEALSRLSQLRTALKQELARFAAILLIVCLPAIASAEFYVAGDVLHNWFAGPAVEGTYKQNRIPNGSQFDGDSLAWGTGIGYRFADGKTWASRGFSLELGYKNAGSLDVGGHWVSDHDYEHTRIHPGHDHPDMQTTHMMLVNRMQGGYLRATKTLYEIAGFEPYATIGVFGASHTVSMAGPREIEVYRGMVLGVSAGGGVKYRIYEGVKLRAGVEAFWTLAETQNPVSSQWTMLGGGIEVPLKW